MPLELDQIPFIPDAQLTSYIRKEMGSYAGGGVGFTGVFAVATLHQTIFTFGNRTYELYDSGTGASTGAADVDIDMLGLLSFNAVIVALAAAIMGDAGQTEVNAFNLGNDTMGLTALNIGVAGNAYVLLCTADPGNHVDVTGAGTLEGGVDQAVKPGAVLRKTITAAEVLMLAATNSVPMGMVDLGGVPHVAGISAMDATGDFLSLIGVGVDLVNVQGTEYEVALRDAAPALANTDVVRVFIELA